MSTELPTLSVSRLPIVAFNDPRAVPCQQSYAACDQAATLHIDAGDWDVDVCLEHSATVLRHVLLSDLD